jgi:hypothetical protein
MDGYPVFDVSDVRRAIYAGSVVYNLGFDEHLPHVYPAGPKPSHCLQAATCC